VSERVDIALLLLLAGAGDELQGMKRGAIELMDVLVVNKADGDNRERAERARADVASALGLLSGVAGSASPPVLTTSALEGTGIAELWSTVLRLARAARASGAFETRRRAQLELWFEDELEAAVRARISAPELASERARLERAVLGGQLSPRAAARQLFG
jgi:LAO/AO transport system kinase